MNPRSVLAGAILVTFAASLFLSLWAFSTCGTLDRLSLGPIAMPEGMCAFFMGTEHIQAWRGLFVAVVASVSLSFGLAVALALRRRILPPFALLPHRQPTLRSWEQLHSSQPTEPLREAYASGIVQHGSRDR